MRILINYRLNIEDDDKNYKNQLKKLAFKINHSQT